MKTRAALIRDLTRVFKKAGFEGATLSRLASATGLSRASLYHHFPGGKEEMARAVMAQNGIDMGRWILTPLSGRKPARQRLAAMLEGVEQFYAGDPPGCLINTLALGDGQALLGEGLAAGVHSWQRALTTALVECGRTADMAEDEALTFLSELEGTLVLSRALSNRQPFERFLARWQTRLSG